MNISDCELLLVLIEEENITKAAERLYTSQSTLSYRIKSLERELDCVLFERSKAGITPTRECRSAAEFAQETLEKYDALLARLSELRTPSEKSEKLSLGATTSVATRFFNQLMKTFQSSHPYAEVSLYANTSDIILKMLEERSLDIAIVRGELEWRGKKALLFEEPLYLVSRRPLDHDKLLDETFLHQPNYTTSSNSLASSWLLENCGSLPQTPLALRALLG